MIAHQLDGPSYIAMINVGAQNLHRYVTEVNDLNVFPIPDGDTGDNMMMTLQGGASVATLEEESLCEAAERVAKGMLLSARGNSGVILSQFFAGIASGFTGLETADAKAMETAFNEGVKRAYESVLTPTEGTILTVAKDATRVACDSNCEELTDFMSCFVDGAKESLERTPDLLSVLKEAGVVDSGGQGLVYIAEGMYNYLTGEYEETDYSEAPSKAPAVANLDLFGPDSVLEFGYCTETLLRLQSSKCDVYNFDVNIIRDYLSSIGNSIVCIKDGSIIKMHVHTMEPYKVLEFCQKYGEFLTIKIENMMLQHEDIVNKSQKTEEKPVRKPHTHYGVVAVANGEGIKDDFIGMGVDEVICGGQTMNPSSADFIEAFNRINADDIFVFPNNGNIIMAAKQAAQMYEGANIHVVETHTIGDAYAALSMLDLTPEDPEEIIEGMKDSILGVVTAEISRSIRDAELNGVSIKRDDYIGILGKEVVSSCTDIVEAAKGAVDRIELGDHGVILVIRGKDGTAEASAEIAAYIRKKCAFVDVIESDGLQEIYDFLIVAE